MEAHSRRHGYDEAGAGVPTGPAISMPNARIEVDRVSGIEGVGVRSDNQVDLAADHVEEFHSSVLVQPLLVNGDRLELSQEGVEFAPVRRKIQTLKPV